MKSRFAPLRIATLIVTLLVLLSPATSAQDGPADAITIENKHVLIMVKAKVAANVIIEKIRTSQCNFDTFPPVLAELRSRGVPDTVLFAMIRAPHGPSSVDQDARGEVFLHPVSEVIKFSGAYVKTRDTSNIFRSKPWVPDSARPTARRAPLNRKKT